MLVTYTRASGSPGVTVVSALRNCVRKSLTLVIPASLERQTSFAPIRIVTYSTLSPTTVVAWPTRSSMRAPLRALLYRRPEMSGLAARMRL
jgi:hypothetical protein